MHLKMSNTFCFAVQSGTSVAVQISQSPNVIYFGDAGSFTFNPLANWPVVVIQGYQLLTTYGAIIAVSLILGLILWGVSISQFTGLFTGL